MDNYKYKLQYADGETVVDYEFSANVNITDFAEHLRRFMAACSWTEGQIDSTIHSDDE